jgi:predicted permease
MSLLTRLRYRWRTLIDGATLDAELDEELADHLRRMTEANITRGLTRAEATRRARLEFGAVQRYKEEARDARGLRWLEELHRDIRFALRMLAKSPVFTVTVVLTLALGIGSSTAVFAAIDATLFRPLAGAQDPDELVQVFRTYPGNEQFSSNSIPHFLDVRSRSTDVFAGAAAWSFTPMSVAVGERPVRLFGAMTSADFFTVLGAKAALGRLFNPAEDVGRGAHPVAVLNDATWKSLFGADPRVIGKTMRVNGRQVEVIGVTAPDFHGAMPVVRPALYLPLMQLEQLRPGSGGDFEDRGNNYLNIIARLRPDVSLAQANARMTALVGELRAEHPSEYVNRGIHLVPQSRSGIHPAMRTAQIGLSTVVMVLVGLLLLLACVNVANLFLARASERSREMAIRLALGARRGLLLRQLMIESLVFAVVAGVLGGMLASWVISLVNTVALPIDFDMSPDLRLSPVVLGFALGATVLTTLLFGTVPALHATRPSLVPALKGEVAVGGSRSRASRVLIIAQMALSIMLLICAGIFAVNLRGAATVDKGFNAEHLLTAQISPSLAGYTDEGAGEVYRRLSERLSALPTVRSVAFAEALPLSLNGSDGGITVPGYVPAKDENMSIQYSIATPGYFRTMETRLLRGREFTPQDDSAAVRVVVVNQRFVDRFWPGQDGIGKTVQAGSRTYTVIGVVTNGKYKTLGEPPTPMMWYAYAQARVLGMAVIVRTTGDPAQFIGTLRSEVAAVDRNLPLSDVRTMNDHLGIALLPARLAGGALGVFGVLGLLLASVGMYGVVAYSVAQRGREIGIRMAIGASGQQLVRMFLREGMSLVLIGGAIGIAGALLGSRLLEGLLYGDTVSPVAFGVVPLVLVTVAAAAIVIPARRAARVDPAIALRAE